MTEHYQTEQEIAAVVAGFENCTTGKEDFTHLSHLTVAAYYLRDSTPDEAFEKMRSGLFRFLDHHAVAPGKYNEQLTRRWLTLVQDVLTQTNSAATLLEVTNIVLERLGDSRMVVAEEDETK
ncbi:MAG TPA: hypothetical protein VGO56_21125 [Pyrinomonadaceae bacterium]|jgi:hypothetical protein|nr:hypothetical protein [Pyrinomonadaceae bacterium]